MTPARARVGSKVMPALIVALVTIETVGLVVALRSLKQERSGEGTRACVQEREEAQALADEVQSLRARAAVAERRLAIGVGRELARAAEVAAQTAPISHTAPSAGAADDTLTRVAEVQARETPDRAWAAAAETRLGDLGRALGSLASIEHVSCTGTLCRVELAHGVGALPAAPLERFLSDANDLLAQVTVHPDPSGSKTTLVFARAGSALPNAEGGGG